VCQLDALARCRNRATLRKSLATLPQTLDQTYDRILTAISKEDRNYAIRILQWLTFSARPLSVEEVAEIVAIDVARDSAFDRDEVLEDPLEALNICSSLVTVTTNEAKGRSRPAQRIIALAHYSVQEYLVSNRIKQGQAKQFSMQDFDCHDTISKGSLMYLLQFQQPLSTEVLGASALARYAAEFWSSHIWKTRDETGSRLAINLMSADNPAYLNWIRLYDPDRPWEESDLGKDSKSIATPLYYAALLGFSTVTRLLLNKDADVHAQGGEYGNALQAASAGGHEQVVKMLLDEGADVNAQGGHCGNALQAASSTGHEQVVKMLLDKDAAVNAQGGYYGNALQAASAGGHEQMVKMLLDNKADVNAQGGHFGNALQAASAGGHEQMVKMLLNNKADVNARGGDYGNALQAASAGGHEQVVKMLLNNKADVNARGGDYGNALQAASAGGHEQMVKMLLDKGADVNAQGGHCGNALQAASSTGHEQVVKMLLDEGADVNAQGVHFGNALQAASAGGHEQVVKMLLSKGADIDTRSVYFGNALQAAAYGGQKHLLELLISKYSISQLHDHYGRTLLWWAAAGGNIGTVETLINQHDIDPQVADTFGRRPSWIAKKKGHGAVSKLLEGYRGEIDQELEMSPKFSNDQWFLECDVCTSNIPASACHYHCNVCAGGDWDMCADCRMTGASCVKPVHTLVKRTMLDGVWIEASS
jgi:ankyrin repeat protein